MSVALPDELELRKIFSPRTLEWLRQISAIDGLEGDTAALTALVSDVAATVSRRAIGGIAHEMGMLRAELAAERSRNADLRARIEHLERVTA